MPQVLYDVALLWRWRLASPASQKSCFWWARSDNIYLARLRGRRSRANKSYELTRCPESKSRFLMIVWRIDDIKISREATTCELTISILQGRSRSMATPRGKHTWDAQRQ
jgi:hypothetical protein